MSFPREKIYCQEGLLYLRCSQCKALKYEELFATSATSAVNRNSWCRSCTRDAKARQRRELGTLTVGKHVRKPVRTREEDDKVRCSSCKIWKDRGDFFSSKDTPCGCASRCKCCLKAKRNRKYFSEYRKRRFLEDPSFKLSCQLRSRLYCATQDQLRTGKFKHTRKVGSAVRDLGCSVPELKVHLEALFQPGMTWKNWGLGADCWHIDHIKPLRSFDLTDRAQFLKAAHFSNLQPLWERDNLSKGGKILCQ